jgi:hypothetical protein
MKPIEPAAAKFGVVKDTPDGRIIYNAAFRRMVAEFDTHSVENSTKYNGLQRPMNGNTTLICLQLCGITM